MSLRLGDRASHVVLLSLACGTLCAVLMASQLKKVGTLKAPQPTAFERRFDIFSGSSPPASGGKGGSS